MANLQKAYFASGCFWCTEAVFEDLKGVENAVSGYTGGSNRNPTYEQVSSGDTNHAEVVEITFDADVISFKTLVEVFFKTHNPTTLNKQGNDVGTQYRSAIFYVDDKQKTEAEEVKKQIEEEKIYEDPVVTTIEEFKEFFEAEKYHQDFYKNNPTQGYCQVVINPKLAKFRKEFLPLLKK